MKNYKKLVAATLAMATLTGTTGCGPINLGMLYNKPATADEYTDNYRDTHDTDENVYDSVNDTVDDTNSTENKHVDLGPGEYRLTIDNLDFSVSFGSGCDVTDYDGILDVQKDIDDTHYIMWNYSGGYVDLYDTSAMTISDMYIDTYNYVDYNDAQYFDVNGETGYVSYVSYHEDGDSDLWYTGTIWQEVGLEHYLEIRFTTNYGDYLRDIDELVECSIISIADKPSVTTNTDNDSNLSSDNISVADFVGKYKTDDLNNASYLDIQASPDEISFRPSFANGWTYTDHFTYMEDGTIQGYCELYTSEAEPDDFVSFTLEKIGDTVYMTIDSSDCPLLEAGEMLVFTAY